MISEGSRAFWVGSELKLKVLLWSFMSKMKYDPLTIHLTKGPKNWKIKQSFAIVFPKFQTSGKFCMLWN